MRRPWATLTLALDYFEPQPQQLTVSAEVRKRLDLATTDTERMDRLIDDILRYTKPIHLALATLEISDVAAEAVGLIRAKPSCEGGENLLHSKSDGASLPISADHDHSMLVLINLLRNAGEAAPRKPKRAGARSR